MPILFSEWLKDHELVRSKWNDPLGESLMGKGYRNQPNARMKQRRPEAANDNEPATDAAANDDNPTSEANIYRPWKPYEAPKSPLGPTFAPYKSKPPYKPRKPYVPPKVSGV
jgi:hypothetical protein